ncbi:Mobile element protein [Methanosarcina siciliae HI350]|uniref:Mobile element protein n=1 Tax=Methanosarcina siciliae HI350 TaxID=1434119 RepID=A0A0E3PG72_9EURY|nr:Mobile element protein [Methanosarcina siciliae HI350]
MCNVFLACEPLTGKRIVKITERKTKRDWAYFPGRNRSST